MMNAEIICIGTELLLGHIVNTNAAFIAKKLAEIGIDHYFDTTVGDNPKRLADTIKTALGRSDIVITTGGLGPTVDDITTQVISEVTKSKLVLEKAVLKDINDYFKRQKRKIPKDSLRQALIPEGSKWLKNPFGTAPGLIISASSSPSPQPSPLWGEGERVRGTGEGFKDKLIIALPGPPREMQPMVENYVMPFLKERVAGNPSTTLGTSGLRGGGSQIIKSRSIKLIGLAEAKVNQKVKDLLNLGGAVQVGIYAKQGEVELKVMAKARNLAAADSEIAKIERTIRKRFGKYVYGADSETLEGGVGDLLSKKKMTIAVAESCTGGLLSNLITNVAGSSSYFKEGIIAYSNEAKIKDLGIPADMIKKYGAVSPEVAKLMARNIRKRANTGIGMCVTGIAGPTGATRTKPVGLVYIALAAKNKTICRKFNFAGTRQEIKSQATQAALDLLRQHV